jgi:membrane protein implicated in regulation of membrane protease activity
VAAVLLFVLTQSVPPIMLLVLGLALYLTWVEVKDEPGLEYGHKLWWMLLVLLTHVPGFLVFRGWVALRRRRRREEESHPPSPAPRGRRGGGPA